MLKFQALTMNRKGCVPVNRRFRQYTQWEQATGRFLAPGTYNESDSYKKLTNQPCSAVYVSGAFKLS